MDLAAEVHVETILPASRKLALAAARRLGLIDDGSTEGEDSGSEEDAFDRDYVFRGEQATLYVLVKRKGKPFANKYEQRDFLLLCRNLEVMVDTMDETCRISSAALCPNQIDRPSDGGSAFDKVFGQACAVYYFQIDVPAISVISEKGPSSPTSQIVNLNVYCRLKSASSKAVLSQMAADMALSLQRERDLFGVSKILPEAQEVLMRNEIEPSISTQTVKVVRSLSKTRCVSVLSRSKQVDGKCFVEVCCENVHDHVIVTLKDLTLHTYTTLPIRIQVSRVGRWTLPMQLLPGERHSVCFQLSNFRALVDSNDFFSPEQENETPLAENNLDNLGNKYTSIATVTWNSDVSLTDVRGKHRVEWQFTSGILNRIVGSLVHSSIETRGKEVPVVESGNRFEVNLEIANRGSKRADIFVLLPLENTEGGVEVVPLDASIPCGTLEPNSDTLSIPLHFLATSPGAVDLSKFVVIYDRDAGESILLKEPFHVTVLEKKN